MIIMNICLTNQLQLKFELCLDVNCQTYFALLPKSHNWHNQVMHVVLCIFVKE